MELMVKIGSESLVARQFQRESGINPLPTSHITLTNSTHHFTYVNTTLSALLQHGSSSSSSEMYVFYVQVSS